MDGAYEKFPLFFGPDGFPGEGFVTPTGQLDLVNVLVPADEDDLEHALPAPDGTTGAFVAVTVYVNDLRVAIDTMHDRIRGT